mgnify:FL=1
MARIPLQWSGGVNLLDAPQAIQDNQLVRSKNSYPSQGGLLDKREAVVAVGKVRVASDGPTAVRPITLFVPDPMLGLDFILHGTTESNGEFLTAVRVDQSDILAAADPEKVYFPDTDGSSGPASLVNYKGRVVGVVGGAEGFIQLNRGADGALTWTRVSFAWPGGDGLPAGALAKQVQSIPVTPKVVCVYLGRLVFANFGLGMENWIVFGDRAAQVGWTNAITAPPWAIIGNDVLASNGRHFEVAAIRGQAITGMREIALQSVSDPLQAALLVQTEQMAIVCTGEPAQTFESGFATAEGYFASFKAQKVNYEVGLAGPGCMCETLYGLCWAGSGTVWLIPQDSSMPVDVGRLIGPALRDTPPNLRKYWSMAYANRTVFLAICTQASVGETDLRIQHWRLDLRHGVEQAAWYGPQDYENIPAFAGVSNYLAASIVSKSGIVHGVTTINTPLSGSVFLSFVSYNEANGGEDIPFQATNTGREWSIDDNINMVTVPVGEIVRPTVSKANGHLYVCTGAGIPGVTEPVWPTTTGGIVADGGATWREIQQAVIWVRPISYYSTLSVPHLMDVLFKDFDFGNPDRDKLVRRANVVAYFGTRALMALRVLVNQGNLALILGPVPIGGSTPLGDPTLAVSGADNELGLLPMDSGAVAGKYQARALRPGYTIGHSAADALATWLIPDTGAATLGGVIRGRNIQPRFTDDDGIVIDSTNDYVSWCSFDPAGQPRVLAVYTAQLTQGRYADIDAVLTEMKAQMNTVQGTVFDGFTINANPWSIDSAYNGNYPYMTTFKLAFTARLSGSLVRFVYGNTDGPITLKGTTCYPVRTKRLLALLGYDTSTTQYIAAGEGNVFSDTSLTRVVGEQVTPVLDSPTRLCGVESVPSRRSPAVSISNMMLDYYIKPGLPFSKLSR